MLEHLDIADAWEIELAAMFSDIGRAFIPDSLQQAESNDALTPAEEKQLRNHPKLAAKLVKRIPRLEQVARHLRSLSKDPGKKVPAPRDQVLVMASALVAEMFGTKKQTIREALEQVQQRFGDFDQEVRDALEKYVQENDFNIRRRWKFRNWSPG